MGRTKGSGGGGWRRREVGCLVRGECGTVSGSSQQLVSVAMR